MSLLQEYPVVIDIPVAWGEMDALSHVNNVIYFRYFETARIDYFRTIGLMDALDLSRQGPVLRDTTCQYRRPVTFPDTLSVGAKIAKLHESHFLMSYEILSQRQQVITTRGEATVVMFDFKKNAKMVIPDVIRQSIIELQLELG